MSLTLAEQALETWYTAPITDTLATVAVALGADSECLTTPGGAVWVYTFADRTCLVVTGKGVTHKVEVCVS